MASAAQLTPPGTPPTWLSGTVERMPGAVRVDHVLLRALESYTGEWQRLLPRALLTYVPGGVCVLVAWLLAGPLASAVVGLLVLYAGVVLLQSVEVAHAAPLSVAYATTSYFPTLWRLRRRLLRLLGGLLLVLVAFSALSFLYNAGATVAAFTTLRCTPTCSINLVVYFLLLGIGLIALAPIMVRWSVLVPVIVLEGRPVWGGLRRCWELTRGETFRLVVWLLSSLFASAVLWGSMHLLLTHLLSDGPVAEFLASAAGDTLGGTFLVILLTQIYLHLLATPRQLPVPPVLQPEEAAPAPSQRARRAPLLLWISSWSIVFAGVAVMVVLTSGGPHFAFAGNGVAPSVRVSAIVLQRAQMTGYTYTGPTADGAGISGAGFLGTESDAFSSVSSVAEAEATAQEAQMVEQDLASGYVSGSNAQAVAGLPSVGTGFVAYTYSSGSITSGVVLWTHAQVVCLIEAYGQVNGPPDMRALAALAALQDGNASRALRDITHSADSQ